MLTLVNEGGGDQRLVNVDKFELFRFNMQSLLFSKNVQMGRWVYTIVWINMVKIIHINH